MWSAFGNLSLVHSVSHRVMAWKEARVTRSRGKPLTKKGYAEASRVDILQSELSTCVDIVTIMSGWVCRSSKQICAHDISVRKGFACRSIRADRLVRWHASFATFSINITTHMPLQSVFCWAALALESLPANFGSEVMKSGHPGAKI